MKPHPHDGLVWLFNTCSDAVKAHAEGCSMLRTAKTRNGIVPVRDVAEKESLVERGFKIVSCKCAK